jgi:lysophospholipase L1-like esterase
MLECLIVGDSIAVGTSQFRPECSSFSQVGITSKNWNNKFANIDLSAKSIIISLGTNDYTGINTFEELANLRSKIKYSNVFWILPVGNSPKNGISLASIQKIIIEIANQNNDTILNISFVSKDQIHPTMNGYRDLAQKSKLPIRKPG